MTRTLQLGEAKHTESTTVPQEDPTSFLTHTADLPLYLGPRDEEARRKTTFEKPKPGQGTLGFLAGDTCVFGVSLMGSCACKNAVPLRLEERLPAAFNAFCGGNPGCSFWGVLGDYFYDQTGAANRNFMNRVSNDVKLRTWLGTPGNHDLWMFGGPATTAMMSGVYKFLQLGFLEDQYIGPGALGFQTRFYYPTDAYGESHFGEFIKDTEGPDTEKRYYDNNLESESQEFGGPMKSKNLVPKDPDVMAAKNSNYFFEQGNLGWIFTSSHGSFQDSLAFFQDACERLYFAPTVDFVFVVTHWNEVAGAIYMGCDEMSATMVYETLALDPTFPGCNALYRENRFRVLTSHKHWTRPNMYRGYPDGDTSGKDHVSCLLSSERITAMNSAMKRRSVQFRGFRAGYVDDHHEVPDEDVIENKIAKYTVDASGCRNFAECTALPRRGMEEVYRGSSYDPDRNFWRDGCSLVRDTYSWGLGGFGMAGDGEWGLPQFDTVSEMCHYKNPRETGGVGGLGVWL